MIKPGKLTLLLSILLVSALMVLGNCKKKEKTPEPEPETNVPVPEPEDTTTTVFEADHANIQYSGRISFSNPKRPKFSAPGVYIKAKFRGTSLAVLFQDQILWGKTNYYDVIIDNGTPVKLTPETGKTYYQVATGLENKEHTVTFVKRTESNIGNCEFLGFRVGQLLTPDPKPTRKIQLIGNSISCGSGSEAANGSTLCNADGWGQPYHNAHVSFGAVMARNLNAEYHITAVSGIGLYRNYSGEYDGRTMPQVYGSLYLESTTSPTWNFSNFQPDAVVIELGTNDFSPGDQTYEPTRTPHIDSAVYVDAYIDFVSTLRGHYPNAHIFCVSSPMLNDGWPSVSDKSQTNLEKALEGVVNHFNTTGNDPNVHKFIVADINGSGCGTHPSAAQHASLASSLGNYVRTTMGW